MSSDKARIAAQEGRVKLHVFEPSGRQVWTVVGKTGEHWVEKEEGFCSCSAYFFDRMRDGKGCYHVESVRMAGKNVHAVKFPDSQYGAFLAQLLSQLQLDDKKIIF